jgi:photosystem II stability/assembly factor-like uncharacterized protein
MKKLVIMLVLGATMISCNNKPIKVENPKQVTTVELQQLASIDSITYKVVEKDNTVYILSTKDNTVVKKVTNDSGLAATCVLFIAVLMFAVLLIAIIKD